MTRKSRRLHKLHALSPFCYWCKKETELKPLLKKGDYWQNSATLDHLDSHWYSYKDIKLPGGARTVLCCMLCNSKRNKWELEQYDVNYFNYKGNKNKNYMAEDKKRTIGKEGFHTVRDGKGELIAVLSRDPITGEHLVYFVTKGTSEDITEKLIRND